MAPDSIKLDFWSDHKIYTLGICANAFAYAVGLFKSVTRYMNSLLKNYLTVYLINFT